MNKPWLLSTLIFLSLTTLLIAQNPPGNWEPHGIGGGGALFCPVFNPHNPDEFYMSCDMGEVFHTTNLGKTWDQVGFRDAAGGNFAQVFFTINPDILYVLQYLEIGKMPAKSTDGGKTWKTLSNFPETGDAFYIYADYNDPDRLIVTTYGTLYLSQDGGSTFSSKFTTQDGAGIILAGAYFTGQDIYIGTNLGILYSGDSGASFSLQPLNGIPDGMGMVSFNAASNNGTTRFWCTAAEKNSIWAGITGADAWGMCKGIYSLDNGANTWVNKTGNINLENDFPFFISSADNNISTVYAAGENSNGMPVVLKTTDNGAHWESVFKTDGNENIYTGWSGSRGDVDYWWGEFAEGFTCASNDVNRLAITDLGFIHTSTDGGATWHQKYVDPAYENPMGTNTPKKKAYKGAFNQTSVWGINWSDSLNVFGCFTDIKGVRSTDAGNTWSFNYTGHDLNTMYCISAHPSNGNIYAATASIHDMYMSYRLRDNPVDDGAGYVLYSANKGADWNILHDFSNNVVWVETDSNNPNRLYACIADSKDGGIYVTNDLQNGSASSWKKLANPPRTEGHPKMVKVLNDGTLVCSYSGRITSGFTESSGVFVSTDNGVSWIDRSDPGMKYWTQDIVIDPFDHSQNTWYVCVFSGWGGAPNGLGGLYRTTDRGVSWKKISNINRVYSCAFNPKNKDEMFITSEADGLWYSKNIRDDNPVIEQVSSYKFGFPLRVFYNPYDNDEVWVASFGNGMMTGKMNSVSDVKQTSGSVLPMGYKLTAYPNPFNPDVNINFNVPENGNVKLEIFNISGELIATLADKYFVKGSYSANWNAASNIAGKVSSGVYICRLILDNKFRKAVKLVLNK